MFQLFVPDFIKNKIFQLVMVFGVLFDVFFSSSLKHVLFLFGLPYLMAVLIFYGMNRKKPLVKAMISAQYKPRNR